MTNRTRSTRWKLLMSVAAAVLLGLVYWGAIRVRPTVEVRSSVTPPWAGYSGAFRQGWQDGLEVAASEYPSYPITRLELTALDESDESSYTGSDTGRYFVRGRVLPVSVPGRANRPSWAPGRLSDYLRGMRWILDRRVSTEQRQAARARLEALRPSDGDLRGLLKTPWEPSSGKWKHEPTKDSYLFDSRDGFDPDADSGGFECGVFEEKFEEGFLEVSVMCLIHRTRSARHVPLVVFDDTRVFRETKTNLIAFYEPGPERWRVIHMPSMTMLRDTLVIRASGN